MKKLLIIFATFGVFFSIQAYAECYSCQARTQSRAIPCGSGSGYSSCECTEPSCGNNSCLDGATCCRVFGNIGASNFTHHFDPTDDDVMPFGQSYNDVYVYPHTEVYKD